MYIMEYSLKNLNIFNHYFCLEKKEEKTNKDKPTSKHKRLTTKKLQTVTSSTNFYQKEKKILKKEIEPSHKKKEVHLLKKSKTYIST